jgi:hypothetical protein
MRERFDEYIGSLFIPQQDETLEWIRTQVELRLGEESLFCVMLYADQSAL